MSTQRGKPRRNSAAKSADSKQPRKNPGKEASKPAPPSEKANVPVKADQQVRLQKLLAEAGMGSRRAMEKRIGAGEVFVNGKVAGLGDGAKVNDIVACGGREWRVESLEVHHRCLVYNKPTGEVTTRSDPQERPTVFDNLPRLRRGRWVAVGRLDINTTGLLLMTTDGELAHAMMHPSNQVDREYACRILGEVTPDMLQNLRQGVELEDGPARFSDIVSSGGSGANTWFHVTLLEGRNREVRRLWASQGVTVSRLKRVRYGAVFLPRRLMMGQYSELEPKDHAVLREDVGLAELPVTLSLLEIGRKAERRRQENKGRGQRGARKAPGLAKKRRSPRQGSTDSDRHKHKRGQGGGATQTGQKTPTARPKGGKPASRNSPDSKARGSAKPGAGPWRSKPTRKK